LEAIMVCLDNSEWTRNGDYAPSRYDAQVDAVNAICRSHTNDSPENTIGIISTAGDRVIVNVTLTKDLGNIVTGLHEVKIEGKSNFVEAIQVAQLALKYRSNKNHGRRIILFVGSPIEETQRDLQRLGGRLKKNGVSVDLVSFGENDINDEKLNAFIDAVNNRDNSRMVSVPRGESILNVVRSSIISGGSAGGFDPFGVDANDDPELAAAIAESMKVSGQTNESIPQEVLNEGVDMDEQDDIMRAIQMSMMDVDQFDETVGGDSVVIPAGHEGTKVDEPMEVDDEIGDDELDSDFMSGLLQSLPGVDVNDPSIQDFLTTFNQPPPKKEDDQ